MKKMLCFLTMIGLLSLSAIEIRMPEKSTICNRTAAEILQRYVGKICPGDRTVFTFRNDPTVPEDAWKIRSVSDGVELSGGGERGVLYAVYHYLEDVCGVMWFSPFEEDVPKKEKLPTSNLDYAGSPAFEWRCIHYSIENKEDSFTSKMRLNSGHDYRIPVKYGEPVIFGGPYFVHTHGLFMPSEKYFKDYPEWYAMIDGKRFAGKGSGMNASQLCLSNKAMRREFIRRVKEQIVKDRRMAEINRVRPPFIYSLTQNDNQKYCRCPECCAFYEYEGSPSGLLIDFTNEVATEIGKEYPDIEFITLAYQFTERTPKHIRPVSNIIICLTDTVSNTLIPLTEKENLYFFNLLREWSKIASKLCIWDYAITYRNPSELPYASEFAYPYDLNLFRVHNVKHIFTELEQSLIGDVRDYKFYLRAKLTENPNADFDKLRTEFANRFYGPAGKFFLEYRDLLRKRQQEKKPYIAMYPNIYAFTHLDIDTLVQAFQMFDEGEKLLQGDDVRLRRWRHARLGIERAALVLSKKLSLDYYIKHGSLEGYPFDREKLAFCIRRTIFEQAEIRLKKWGGHLYSVELQQMEKELEKYNRPLNKKALVLPEKFRDYPRNRIFDYSIPEEGYLHRNIFRVVPDTESSLGVTARMTFPIPDELGSHPLEKYLLPMNFQIYSSGLKKNIGGMRLAVDQIKSGGYNWCKIGTVKLSSDCYMPFFWSWILQVGVADAFDPNHEDAKFDVWLSIKFTGPAYPFGKAQDPNTISIDRLILIRDSATR